MSKDRELIIRARSLALGMVLDPTMDNARMLSKAVDDLCRAFQAAIDRGLRAEEAVHELIKERRE